MKKNKCKALSLILAFNLIILTGCAQKDNASAAPDETTQVATSEAETFQSETVENTTSESEISEIQTKYQMKNDISGEISKLN